MFAHSVAPIKCSRASAIILFDTPYFFPIYFKIIIFNHSNIRFQRITMFDYNIEQIIISVVINIPFEINHSALTELLTVN